MRQRLEKAHQSGATLLEFIVYLGISTLMLYASISLTTTLYRTAFTSLHYRCPIFDTLAYLLLIRDLRTTPADPALWLAQKDDCIAWRFHDARKGEHIIGWRFKGDRLARMTIAYNPHEAYAMKKKAFKTALNNIVSGKFCITYNKDHSSITRIDTHITTRSQRSSYQHRHDTATETKIISQAMRNGIHRYGK